MTTVSVIIPTRNRAALLQQAIESVLAVERRGFELEVLVVDDGSTDWTPELVARYPITYLRTSGIGVSAARNTGILAAHGAFIAFLDDDDVWLPTNISPQLEMLEANPTYGAAHAQVILTDPDRRSLGTLLPVGPLTSGWIFQNLLTYWPQCASIVIRRSVLRDIGLFDPSLHSEEDWDLFLRIARRYPMGRVEQPVALFRQRCDNDEIRSRARMPDTLRVFHRHTCDESVWRRFLWQRVLWRHRGWYAALFLSYARAHARTGAQRRALAGLTYAAFASPLHLLKESPQVCITLTQILARTLSNLRKPASSLSD
jgi:glycosyltransferase involved in cell wall biosynthesis